MNLRDKVEAAILQGWGVINLDEGEPYREQEADINRSIEAILTLIRSTVIEELEGLQAGSAFATLPELVERVDQRISKWVGKDE